MDVMTDYAAITGASTVQGLEYTGALRWLDDRLQQEVKLTSYKDGIPFKVEREWRDVPQRKSA